MLIFNANFCKLYYRVETLILIRLQPKAPVKLNFLVVLCNSLLVIFVYLNTLSDMYYWINVSSRD